jgi:hypothetical protein
LNVSSRYDAELGRLTHAKSAVNEFPVAGPLFELAENHPAALRRALWIEIAIFEAYLS